MFNDLDKNQLIKNFVDKWLSKFNAKLNGMKREEALDYLGKLRTKGWIVPSVIWVFTSITILAGAITTLNWALLALLLFFVNFANLQFTVLINQYIYNITTRRSDLDPEARVKELWKVRRAGTFQNVYSAGASGTLPFAFCICPYLEFLRLHPTATGWTIGTIDSVLGDPILIRAILLSLPIVMTFLDYRGEKAMEEIYKDTLGRNLANKRYNDPELQNMLSGYHQEGNHNEKKESQPEQDPEKDEGQRLTDPEPYVTIGKSIRTGEMVELTPVQRKQNAIYVGPIGSGKTSTIFIPQIRQDIDHYLKLIRDYPKLSKTPGFMEKKNNAATHYLGAIAVVETSNDLCASIYKLARQMGVPEEKIVWFDPSNPSTPSLNLLRGPIPIVTENVSNIINGVKTENSDFFQQSERTHLKMYITLLKMSAVIEGKTPDFSDLMDLYSDVYLVLEKMQYLEQYVKILKEKVVSKQDKFEELKEEGSGASSASVKMARTDFEEINAKYKVASNTLKWFKNSIQPKTFGAAMLKHKTGDRVGQIIYEDINDQNIAGLRNTLNDLAQNTLLRRILFRDSGDFSFDNFYRDGGILLCNTAKSELQDSLAKTIGQVYMISLATAAFRRKPDTAPLASIYLDEFPDFLYSDFPSFLAQARKYNISIVIATQTFSQLARENGREYAETIMSNMLTRGAFGDLSPGDAEILEPYFGEKYRTTEDVSNQDVGALSGDLTNKRSLTSKSGYEPNITASDLMQLQKFNIAVRHPDPQGSVMFDIIKTKYLTDKDILSDPNVFDMNDERDADAYETMMYEQHHDNGNPDLDDVDAKIAEEIKDGEIEVEPIDMDKVLYEADKKDDKSGKNGSSNNDRNNEDRHRRFSDGDEPPVSKSKKSSTSSTKTDSVIGIASALGAIDSDDKADEKKALDNATKFGSGGNKRESNNNIVTGIPLFAMDGNDAEDPEGDESEPSEDAKKAPQEEEQVFTEDDSDDDLEDADDAETDSDSESDGEASDKLSNDGVAEVSEDKENADIEETSEEESDQIDAIDANDETESADVANTDVPNSSMTQEDLETELGQLIEDNQDQLMTVDVMSKAFKPVLERIENSSDPELATHANEEKIVSQLESAKKIAKEKAMEYLPAVLEESGKSLPKNKSLEDFAEAWTDHMLGIDKLIKKHQKLASDAQQEEEQATQDLFARFAKMQHESDEN